MPWATQEVQLEALEAARAAVREDSSNAGHVALVALARAQSCAKPEAQTLLAIIAVLDRVEHPAKFRSDRDAYETHGVKQTTFKTWKGRISQLMSAQLVNEEVELSLQDELTISGVMEMAASTDKVRGAVLPDSLGSQNLSGAMGSIRLGSSEAGASGEEGVMDTEPHLQHTFSQTGLCETVAAAMRANPEDLDIQRKGCADAESLTRELDGCGQAVGFLEGLVMAMRLHPADLPIQRDGCGALSNVTEGDAACKQAVAAASGLGVVVAAMQTHPSDSLIQQIGPGIIRKLTSSGAGGTQLVGLAFSDADGLQVANVVTSEKLDYSSEDPNALPVLPIHTLTGHWGMPHPHPEQHIRICSFVAPEVTPCVALAW